MASIEELRQLSYKYFPIKRPLIFEIETDKRTARIEGYVESNEPDIFTDMEQLNITLLCPNPYFSSVEDEVTKFYGMTPTFEFLVNDDMEPIPEPPDSPYSTLDNNSLVDKLISMGRVEKRTYNIIPYSGDAETGIIVTMHAIGTVENIDIYNTLTREHMRIDTGLLAAKTGSVMINGDTIYINTIPGQKKITLLRNGVETNILNCINRDADWFKLAKGNNIIAYTAEEGAANLQFEVSHHVLYEGM